MPGISYENARATLESAFAEVEAAHLNGHFPRFDLGNLPFDLVFQSKTQAYKETLLGCLIARIQDKTVNIRSPYVSQGEAAFNGRTLDEKVVNPFLRSREIPCSKGPYLGVFRRSVQFKPATKKGLRDKEGYVAFLEILDFLESTREDQKLREVLWVLLQRFLLLREESRIELLKVKTISQQQYDSLITGLLSTQSGGRVPVLLAVAMFRTINDSFELEWDVRFQGINVADEASGASGDVTIRSDGKVLLAAEITERVVERSRVEATFRTKISPNGIEDYLFMMDRENIREEARELAQRYFAQGHEVSFVDIKEWILMSLVTVGRAGRQIFNRHLLSMLEGPEIPKSVKVSWNAQVQRLTD